MTTTTPVDAQLGAAVSRGPDRLLKAATTPDGIAPGALAPMAAAVAGKRRRAACLHLDVAGYSCLIADDLEATVRTLKSYRALIGRLVAAHCGRVVDATGDSVLAEFPLASAAVQAAVEIQRRLRARNAALPPQRRMEFRAGVDCGEVLEDDGRIYGECVNSAARVQELAPAGGISLAAGAFDELEVALARRFQYAGERAVKNMSQPLRLYRFAGP